jgi:chorismate mutase
MRNKRPTREEKVAQKLIELVNDFTLDLDTVGRYVAEQSHSVLYNRLDTVLDSAQYEKEQLYDRAKHNTFRD